MPKDKTILIKEYLQKVEAANKELTKKEAFKDLLNRLYAGNAKTEKFNEKNKTHLKLAASSEKAHKKAKKYITANLPKQELSAIHLGRYRMEIKKHLKEEMEGIDELVGEVIG